MRLSKIIGEYPTKEVLKDDVEILQLVIDSREKSNNGLFFCLKGENFDGERFACQAVQSGCVAVVSQSPVECGAVNVVVDDVREAMSFFSASFYGNPQNSLKIIGLVGTNGKTSTCHIIRNILEKWGKRAAVIGTLGVKFGDEKQPGDLTTPDPAKLFKTLADLSNSGAEYVIMEVSAHAIWLKKVSAIKFEALVFTNCTEDHLDYFKSFEIYRSVKKSILTHKNAKYLIVNADDPLGREIAARGLRNTVSYAIDGPADVFAVDIRESKNKTEFILNALDAIYEISGPLLGKFNVYNALAAASACVKLGVPIDCVAEGISSSEIIDGRMEKVTELRGADVFVDYAHTPDGLEKSLLFLRGVTDGRLICLFGCGGNREKEKRPIMGRIAGDVADFVIITSDNPRYEEPSAIISEIESGVRESSFDYICITRREDAIAYALGLLNAGDSLLIAGKGAEEYQEIMGVKHPFSDAETVLRLANG